MNPIIVFQDGSSMTDEEWSNIKVRDELFCNGFASLFKAKKFVKPNTHAAIKYVADQRLRKLVVAKNGESCW
jgi:hypothetical protein